MKATILMCIMLLTSGIFLGQNSLTIDNRAERFQAKYTFLNGINFDFNGEDKSNYVGHCNIYVPAVDAVAAVPAVVAGPGIAAVPAIPAIEENNWAINTGLLKITYMPNDSLVETKTENVLIAPLDIVDGTGDKYNKQYNRYSTQTIASSFSLYVQPMYRFKTIGTAQIYVHGHLELLISKYVTNTKIKTIQSEEVTLADGDPIPTENDLIRMLPSQASKTVNLNTGNLGLGLTFDFNFRDNCVLFFQATSGISLNHANDFPTIDNEGNYTIATSGKSQKFYLVRTYFQYFTSKASQLVIGTDIRGYFPKQTPYTSVYIGVNLGLDKIFSM
jgi:hypothetical protein